MAKKFPKIELSREPFKKALTQGEEEVKKQEELLEGESSKNNFWNFIIKLIWRF